MRQESHKIGMTIQKMEKARQNRKNKQTVLERAREARIVERRGAVDFVECVHVRFILEHHVHVLT